MHAPALPDAPAPAQVAICSSTAEWPPFTYYRRVDGVATGELVGYSVEVITAILRKANLAFRIELLPWKRCLREVARGDRFQIALEASHNAERARTYWMSRPFYNTVSHYFYSRRRFPDGPAILGVGDLRRLRLCGLLGYNYEPYGLDATAVDQTAGDHSQLVQRLKLGRCDLFVEKIEVLAGYARTGRDLLADPDLGHLPLPNFPASEFHMLITRGAPGGRELLRIIDAGLIELESSKQLDRLRAKYLR